MLKYEIYHKDAVVGQAQLEKQGMFYIVRCICNLPMDNGMRLYLQSNGTGIDLGILVALKEGIGLVSRISANQLCISDLRFSVMQKREFNGDLQEVTEDKAFPLLDKLTDARFVRRNAKAYILLP